LAFGPTLGVILASLWSWRLVFLINIPIGIVAFLWGWKVIPKLKGQPGKIDTTGAVAAFICLFSFLFFINQLQGTGIGPTTVGALAIAIISGISFIYIENHSPQPMVKLALFANKTFTLGNISAMLNFASQYIMVFATPFYLQRVLHYPPDKIGFLMTCFPLAVMIIAPFSGTLSDRLGTRGLAAAGAALCAVALATMAFLPVEASPLTVGWRLAFFGLGTGLFQSPNNSAVMGSAPRLHLGVASGVLATVRNTGMAIGIAMAGLMLYSVVPANIIALEYLDGLQAVSFLEGLQYAYLLGAIFSALAALLSLPQAKHV
jgi:MFS family permease